MNKTLVRFLSAPLLLLLLTFAGCGGGGDQQVTNSTDLSSTDTSSAVLTAEDVATFQAIENSIASLDAKADAGPAALAAAAVATAAPAEKKVFGKKTFIVPKAGTVTYGRTFKGLVDGAQGTLVFYNSYGKDIPTTPCIGTARQIRVCEVSRDRALAWNPTSVEVILNGQTVIAPNQIPRTQGVATIPVTVNKLNNQLLINLSGKAYSFIQLMVKSQLVAAPPSNPVADFVFSPSTGLVPILVFFDGSLSTTPNGTIVNYAWDFGDGFQGIGVNPEHFYEVEGTHNVVLTVTDSVGRTATKSASIVILPPEYPTANFTYSINAGTGTLDVDGSASFSPTLAIVAYYWNWGDGSPTALGITSSHTYNAPGVYVVTLVVENETNNFGYTSQIVTIPASGPTADFTFTPTTGGTPLAVNFDAGLSSSPNGALTNYVWDYGDGATGTGLTTTHVYQTPGTFTFTLTATDSVGLTGTRTAQIIVTQPQPPVAAFTHTVDLSTGAIVVNTDGSASSSPNGTIVTYMWDWGDSSALDFGAIGSHTYLQPGTYTITLFVTDSAGLTGSTSMTITVP